jgi:hypothetical protein
MSRALLEISGYVAALLLLEVVGPDTPLGFIIGVAIIVVALYRNSVFWRKFIERQQAKTAATLGGSPDQLRAVLKDLNRLLPHDPLAAQRTIKNYSRPLRERSRAKREELWHRARLHRSAAHELEQDLQDEIATCRHALNRVRKMSVQEPGMSAVAHDLEEQLRAAEQDLAKVRALLTPGISPDGAA